MNTIVAITAGEPAGIGPDLLVSLAHIPFKNASFAIIANAGLLAERARLLAKPLTIKPFDKHSVAPHLGDGTLTVVDIPLQHPVAVGQPNTKNSSHVLEQLGIAVKGCLQKEFSALVTCPVNKAVLCQSGTDFSGHTEYLAQACDCNTVMLLETKNLRVALATTHVPLQKVSGLLSKERLKKTLRTLEQGLTQQLKIARPRIAVCGLNPHAGEQGYLGREEIDIIAPAIEELSKEGLAVFGPIPADTAFRRQQLELCDVVFAMYHDQGLPVIKYAGFGHVVNITLGLPFVRTSVDHGTALELAGRGQAETTSLEAAIQRAIELSA